MKCEIMSHGYIDYFYGEMRVTLYSLEATNIFDKTMRLGVSSEGRRLYHSQIARLFHFLDLFEVPVDIQEDTDYWTMSFTYLGNGEEKNIVKIRFWHDYADLVLNGVCKDPTLLVDTLCREITKQEERQAKLYEASINK